MALIMTCGSGEKHVKIILFITRQGTCISECIAATDNSLVGIRSNQH